MHFNLEELYGCTRESFCSLTGTNMEDMAIRLRKEVTILSANLAVVRVQYIDGGSITEDEQRRRAKLIKAIESKIDAKNAKILDIEKYLKG